ncbi:unnamed protein product [Adineta ricciae]|uniref:Mitochondrial import inner membrane translocase subunit TIM50 n=2 Tax=Adineta ricciae TaxID=249248 RepID=A0A814DPI9_ADIRI|nr:unnamed protein product [Adineta ricciae]
MPPIPASRLQQSSSVNTNITLNDNNRERMLARLLVVIKRIVKFLVHCLTFMFVALRGSRKKLIQFQSVKYYNCPLQPLSAHRLHFLPKKILVLDLDETLVHSHHDGFSRNGALKPTGPPDFIVRVEIEKHPVRFFVYKRPHVDYFLETVSQWYELVVFTASMEIYGAAVSDKLDNNRNMLARRYFRQHLIFREYLSWITVLLHIVVVHSMPFRLNHGFPIQQTLVSCRYFHFSMPYDFVRTYSITSILLVIKTDKERDRMTKINDQMTSSGRVKQICQNFLLHADSGLAHRLQQEEFAVHFDRNRTHRRESQLGVRAARNVEQEEKKAFIEEQVHFCQEKQKMAEIDTALARQLQKELKISSSSKDQTMINTHYRSHEKKNYHEQTDQPVTHPDTSSDEQLARILQEEEELLSSAAHRSLYRSAFV